MGIGEVLGSSPGYIKKVILTAPQPVLVIMSLSKRNALVHTLYNGPSGKVGLI